MKTTFYLNRPAEETVKEFLKHCRIVETCTTDYNFRKLIKAVDVGAREGDFANGSL